MSIQTRLGRVVILVEDYDAAWQFYEKNFFCTKLFDQVTADGKRYLHIGFSDDDGTGIWLLKADDSHLQTIGHQTGGQPTIVVYTDDAEKLYVHIRNNGVKIAQEMVSSDGAMFFQCFDLYGNKIVVVELEK